MFYNSISKQRSVLTNYKLCLWGLVGWLGKVSSWLTNGSFLFAQKTRISMTTVRQPICHPPTPLDSLLGESQSSEDVNVSQSKLNHNKKNLYFWTFPKLLHPPSPPTLHASWAFFPSFAASICCFFRCLNLSENYRSDRGLFQQCWLFWLSTTKHPLLKYKKDNFVDTIVEIFNLIWTPNGQLLLRIKVTWFCFMQPKIINFFLRLQRLAKNLQTRSLSPPFFILVSGQECMEVICGCQC